MPRTRSPAVDAINAMDAAAKEAGLPAARAATTTGAEADGPTLPIRATPADDDALLPHRPGTACGGRRSCGRATILRRSRRRWRRQRCPRRSISTRRARERQFAARLAQRRREQKGRAAAAAAAGSGPAAATGPPGSRSSWARARPRRRGLLGGVGEGGQGGAAAAVRGPMATRWALDDDGYDDDDDGWRCGGSRGGGAGAGSWIFIGSDDSVEGRRGTWASSCARAGGGRGSQRGGEREILD